MESTKTSLRTIWGAHAPSRAAFGASPNATLPAELKFAARAPQMARGARALPDLHER
ncbi:MAG: hypothetical protein QOG67_3701 [Verrucomicrobiota bacterium]